MSTNELGPPPRPDGLVVPPSLPLLAVSMSNLPPSAPQGRGQVPIHAPSPTHRAHRNPIGTTPDCFDGWG